MKVLLIALIFAFPLMIQDEDRIHIFMIGDSTMANKKEEARPETGWGQVFNAFFDERVVVSNHAKNGRSSKSFRDEGLWKVVLDSLKKGDYVIIQFGHNDSKPDVERHTDPRTTYKSNLFRYIGETREKGAIPILCTSIVRRKFDDKGKLVETHGEYPEVVREVAHEMSVPLLDLQQMTADLVSEMGPEESRKLYLHTEPGEFSNRPEGVKDDTHLNREGAKRIAALAAEALRELKVGLDDYFK